MGKKRKELYVKLTILFVRLIIGWNILLEVYDCQIFVIICDNIAASNDYPLAKNPDSVDWLILIFIPD